MSKEKKRVAIYVRVSTLDQAREGYSLAAQRKAIEEWAHRNAYDVTRVYEDAGISGKDIEHRPAMREMLEAAKRKEFDIIGFWALSRFTRSIVDLYQTIDYLNQYNVTICSYTEPFDTSSVFGRFSVGILGLVAQLERELTSERVKLAMQERAAQGKRTTSEVLGYDLDGADGLKVNEAEAKEVQYIFDSYLEFKNLSAVAEMCSLRGYRGKRGRVFKAQHIKTILTRPIYVGYNSYMNMIYKGNHEPIIPLPKYNRVQRLLGAPTIQQTKDTGKTTEK